MDNTEKLLADLAAQLGFDSPSMSKSARMSDLADKYRGKSDQELISEIMKIRRNLKKDRIQYENQMRAIKALRSVMSGEQRARLEKLIRLREEDD